MAFFSYSFGTNLVRIGYAIAIGIVFLVSASGIVRAFDKDFKQKSGLLEKIEALMSAFVFPILYVFIHDYADKTLYDAGRCHIAWLSLIMVLIIMAVLRWIVKIVIKMFKE